MERTLTASEKLLTTEGPRSAALHRYSATSQSLLLVADVLAFFASFYVAMGLVNRTWDLRNFEALILKSQASRLRCGCSSSPSWECIGLRQL